MQKLKKYARLSLAEFTQAEQQLTRWRKPLKVLPYPVGYDPQAVTDKYTAINRRGAEILVEGTCKTYPTQEDFEPAWGLDLHVAALLTEESQETLLNRVIRPIAAAAARCGFEYWFAGDHGALFHSTLLSGFVVSSRGDEELPFAERFAKQTPYFEELREDSALTKVNRHYMPPPMEFPFLTIGGGNSLAINCVAIPEQVAQARQLLTLMFERGLGHRDMTNILHVTLGRLRTMPQDPQQRANFVAELLLLAQTLATNPPVLKFERIVFVRDIQRNPRF